MCSQKLREKGFEEAVILRNGEKVSRKAVTISSIDNEINSRFLGVEKTDNDGQVCWVVDNPKKAVLTVVYDEWREKNEPLYKISIMRKAKIVSAWEGVYLDEFKEDLTEASEDWSFIPTLTESSECIKDSIFEDIQDILLDINTNCSDINLKTQGFINALLKNFKLNTCNTSNQQDIMFVIDSVDRIANNLFEEGYEDYAESLWDSIADFRQNDFIISENKKSKNRKVKEAFYRNEYGEECNPEDIGYQRIDYSDNEEVVGYSFDKKYKLIYEANEDIYWICKHSSEYDRWTKIDFAKKYEDYLKTLIKRYKIETDI